MPRQFLKRILPKPETFENNKSLRFLKGLMDNPNIWHLNRRSVANAFFVGIFCAFLPIPFQMPVAAMIAIFARCNLPIAVSLVWISNPITIPPLVYFTYQVGLFIMSREIPKGNFEPTVNWALNHLEPFLLGCLVCGFTFASVGYCAIKIIWRWQVVSHRKKRKTQRKKEK